MKPHILALGILGSVITVGGGGSSPLTTKGDLYGRSASADARVPVGADGLCLKADSSDAEGVVWASCGGGAGNFAAVTVDFTTAGKSHVATVVTGQTWVSGSSVILCSPTLIATGTRTEGEEDAVIEGLHYAISDRSAGVGFTLHVAPARGIAHGQFVFHCTGS